MSKLPLVSVIIPTYNAGQYIIETLQSVLRQDYSPIEIIIVDDGSTDDTLDKIKQFTFTCPTKIIRQMNMGPAVARNRAAMESQGEFLAFIDADDVWLENKLSSQITYLQNNPDVGIVHGRYLRWYPNDNGVFGAYPTGHSESLLDPNSYASGWVYPELLLDSHVWIVTAMVRKSIWEQLGGLDRQYWIGEDYDFFIRASRHTRIVKLNQLLAYYRKHPNSITRALPTKNYEYIVVNNAIKRFGLVGTDGRTITKDQLNQRLHKLCFDYAYLHYWQGNANVALAAFQQGHLYQKTHLKTTIYWLLAYTKSFFIQCKSWTLKINKKYDTPNSLGKWKVSKIHNQLNKNEY